MAALAYLVNLFFTNPYNPHKKDIASEMVCGNRVPSSYQDPAAKTSKPDVYQPTFAYIIALMVFGTAFGNMFVMRGHYQRYGSSFNKSYSRAQSSYYNNTGYTSGQYYQSYAKHDKWRYRSPQEEYNFGRVTKSMGVPSHIKLYLAQLHMPTSTAPSVTEVKNAYRQFSLKYHPDMRRNDVASVRKEAEAKFVQGTKAYDELIKYLERDT